MNLLDNEPRVWIAPGIFIRPGQKQPGEAVISKDRYFTLDGLEAP
jgi:hypothetical protein